MLYDFTGTYLTLEEEKFLAECLDALPVMENNINMPQYIPVESKVNAGHWYVNQVRDGVETTICIFLGRDMLANMDRAIEYAELMNEKEGVGL